MRTEAQSNEQIKRLALSPTEAAESLGLSPRKLNEIIASRDSGIPTVRVGRRVLLPVRELEDWLTNNLGNCI